MFKHVMAWSILAIIAIIFPMPGTAVFYFTIVTPCYLALLVLIKVMSTIFKSRREV